MIHHHDQILPDDRGTAMRTRYLPWIAFVLLAACQIALTIYYLAYLPARVAVHFDPAGRPNGWMSNADVLTGAAIEIAIMTAIFVAAGLLRFIPVNLLNLPNKDYWLAPEWREGAMAFIRDWLRWFVVLTLAFLSVVQCAVLRANLTMPARLAPIWVGLVVPFLIIVVVMIVRLLRRFRLPPAGMSGPDRTADALTRSKTN
jgi:uncharacterized membrane protein